MAADAAAAADAAGGDMSFETFRAIRKRNRDGGDAAALPSDVVTGGGGGKPARGPKAGKGGEVAASAASRAREAPFAVSAQLRLVLLALVVADVVATVVTMLWEAHSTCGMAAADAGHGGKHAPKAATAFAAFAEEEHWLVARLASVTPVLSALSIGGSALELLMLLVQAPRELLTRKRRWLDFLCVVAFVHFGVFRARTLARLAAVPRAIWRVADLVDSVQTELHDAVMSSDKLLATEKRTTADLRRKLEQATSKWRHEQKTRENAEAQMHKYSREATELREALMVAAHDVMRVTAGGDLADTDLGEFVDFAEEEARRAQQAKFVVAEDGSYSAARGAGAANLRGASSAGGGGGGTSGSTAGKAQGGRAKKA